MTRRILVVEDDATIRSGLRDALVSEGYEVLEAADGPAGLRAALTEDPDLIVLDLMLPGMNGEEVLARLRADALETPVLVLTARGLEADKVRGFEAGADDYVVKPFGLAELLARIASRLRPWDRERGLVDRDSLRIGAAMVDFSARLVRRNGENQTLTPTEIRLLRCLVAHEGRPLSRARILDVVWGEQEVVSRVVDMAISNLRRKLEADPAHPRHILSVRGVGYRFSRAP